MGEQEVWEFGDNLSCTQPSKQKMSPLLSQVRTICRELFPILRHATELCICEICF